MEAPTGERRVQSALGAGAVGPKSRPGGRLAPLMPRASCDRPEAEIDRRLQTDPLRLETGSWVVLAVVQQSTERTIWTIDAPKQVA